MGSPRRETWNATPTRGVESERNCRSLEKVASHGKTLLRKAVGCRDAFDVRAAVSSAEGGFERRTMQADRVTGAEPAVGAGGRRLRDRRAVCAGRREDHGAADTTHGVADTIHGAADTIHGVADTIHGVADTIHGAADTTHGAADTTHSAADTTDTRNATRIDVAGGFHSAGLRVGVRIRRLTTPSSATAERGAARAQPWNERQTPKCS